MAPSAMTTSPAPAAELTAALRQRSGVRQLWVGNLLDTSGHADGNRAFLNSLEHSGYEPALHELPWRDGGSAELSPAALAVMDRQTRRNIKPPLVAVHTYPAFLHQRTMLGVPNVHRAVFETDRIPKAWLTPLLDRDEVWVPSAFNAETFVRGGIPEDRLRVVGDTIDLEMFAPGVEPWPVDTPDGAFVFLSNFDFSERKGWKQLLRGWARAFGPDDDVCLLLKVGSFYVENESVVNRIRSFIREDLGAAAADRLAPIRFLTDRLPAAAMPRLYAAADAYVLPTRGEGVGRPYMEAMAMGLPTVASNWSGNLEFMNPESTWLIDGEVVDVPEQVDLFNNLYQGHRWFEADADELAAALREIASDPDAARAKAAPARDELERGFGFRAIADRLDELAEAAWERHSERRAQPVTIAVRGGFGAVDSLAIGNDALAGWYHERGGNVVLRGPKTVKVPEAAPGVSQSWPPEFDPATDGPTVVILPWEFGPPPSEWLDEIRRKVDRVWVPSDYVRRGYVDAGMPAGIVETIPSGADVELFTPEGPAYELPRQAGCTFLFVGGTTWRKGADVLIEGWRRAFGPDDDVQLVIKDFGVAGAYRNQTSGDAIKRIAASGTTAPIVYIDQQLAFDELPALYRAADAVVLPYRAEGFCLPAVEAMASGVPVIHNGEGPTGEFVGDVGGWPLPAARVPLPAQKELPELAAPGYVHEVDPDVLAERLRAVAADAEGRRERGARARERAIEFSWDRFAERAADSLARLEREGLPLARQIRRAEIEARTHFAVYAPDWSDPAAWQPALDAWIAAFGSADDVTLALYVDGDAEAIGERIMAHLAGRDQSDLPDLALVLPSDVTLTSLSASADAVMIDGPADPAARPELLRRAQRILAAEGEALAAWATQLRGELRS